MRSKFTSLITAFAVLYGAEALADNTSPSMLSEEDRSKLEKLMPEDFNKFMLHDEPRPFRDKTFVNAKNEDIDLHEFDGSVTLVNFWATWCPPCLKELPGMDKLQTELADDGLDLGLPVTAILGPDGREIGRLVGEAEWDTEAVQEMLRFLIEATDVSDPDRKEASAPEHNRAG